MRIPSSIGLFGIGRFSHAQVRVPRALGAHPLQLRTSGQVQRNEAAGHRQQVLRTLEKIETLRKTLEGIDAQKFNVRTLSGTITTNTVSAPAAATSASDLGFNTSTLTSLQSTEEINATPTSFSPFGPTFVGSTAQPTIGGAYLGTNGTGTLTFRVDRGGTHGVDDLKIKVYNPDGSFYQDINIQKEDLIDQPYTMLNGLTLTLGAGSLVKDDTFTVDVESSLPASYTPTQPVFRGSTAEATIGGVYDGSSGTGTLTFRVNHEDGTHGVDDLKIKVYNPDGSHLQDINIKKEDPINQPYTLDNGLALTLGAGDLLEATYFTVDVNDTVGSTVELDKPFNGVRNDNPNLQDGFSVTDGSFQLNGVTINVNASDTLNMVLDRMTQSSAGVTATFDAATETVLLTHETSGAPGNIVLQNDTSGFLAAMKLDTATQTQSENGDVHKTLATVPRFASVQSGTIHVNGIAISIDVNADSLTDVLDRINASAAGVTASLNPAGQRVSLVSTDANQQLILASGGTGFFAALEMTDGTHDPTPDQATLAYRRQVGVSQRNAQRITIDVDNFARALNALFHDPKFAPPSSPVLTQLRDSVQGLIAEHFDTEGLLFDPKIGLRFNFRHTSPQIVDFSPSVQNQFLSTLRTRSGAETIRDLFFGPDASEQGGLVDRLHAFLEQSEADLKAQLTAVGSLIDVLA